MKTPILRFGTSCRTCARGLHIADDGEKYCPVCTRFTVAAPVPAEPFVATVGPEAVEQADTLDELLGILAEITEDQPTEDIVLTRGQRVVMVLFANGEVLDRRRALSC